MLRSLGVGRWLGFAVLAMVALAIWKTNDGDLGRIADGIWSILNMGADAVSALWENFSESTGDAADSGAGSGAGSDSKPESSGS